jgi:hypothetical protein
MLELNLKSNNLKKKNKHIVIMFIKLLIFNKININYMIYKIKMIINI